MVRVRYLHLNYLKLRLDFFPLKHIFIDSKEGMERKREKHQ